MAIKILPPICFALCFVLVYSETVFAKCNPFRGNWVFDKSYPLYEPLSCPHVRREYDCAKYGRRDTLYLKYRWQPDSCDIPRFDGMGFLKKMKGKKIMLVGDSLSMDQYESLLCLLHAAAPNAKKTILGVGGNLPVGVRFKDYNVSIELYSTHYLVDIVEERFGTVLDLGSLSGGRVWQTADVLIFNTGQWWWGDTNSKWNFTRDGNKIVKNYDSITSFTKALQSWAKWVDKTIDPSKAKVIYQSTSPNHDHGADWSAPSSVSCMGQTQPITNSSQYIAGPNPLEAIVKKTLHTMKKPVYLLDISYLSQLRKDAHPSKFNGVPGRKNDCLHWCIPGLPDTWNQLLYNALVQ